MYLIPPDNANHRLASESNSYYCYVSTLSKLYMIKYLCISICCQLFYYLCLDLFVTKLLHEYLACKTWFGHYCLVIYQNTWCLIYRCLINHFVVGSHLSFLCINCDLKWALFLARHIQFRCRIFLKNNQVCLSISILTLMPRLSSLYGVLHIEIALVLDQLEFAM